MNATNDGHASPYQCCQWPANGLAAKLHCKAPRLAYYGQEPLELV
jgi:hypothetical protein